MNNFINIAISKIGENEFRLFCDKEKNYGYYEIKNAFNRIINKSEILHYKKACNEYDSIRREYKNAHGLKLK